MKAKYLMAQDVAAGLPTTTVKEAHKIMRQRGISGIPIVDDQNRIVGIFSASDAPNKPDIENSAIANYMKTPAITVDEEDPIEDVATLMSINGINRIPVTSHERLVGVIARDDIIRYVATRRAWPETEPRRQNEP